jgi:hypothetical protein
MNINFLKINGYLDGKGLNLEKLGRNELLNKCIRCMKIMVLKIMDGLTS